VNGRKLRFISVDDACNPARTVEQVRFNGARYEALGKPVGH
jgi:hypothetical protein